MFFADLESEVIFEVAEALRVPVTDGPDLRSRVLLAHEWIVLRNSAVVIQTKRLAGE